MTHDMASATAPTCLPFGNCSGTPYPLPLFSWPHSFVPANAFDSREKACLERAGKASFSLCWPAQLSPRLDYPCGRWTLREGWGPLEAHGSFPRPTTLKCSTPRPGARPVLAAAISLGRLRGQYGAQEDR